MECRGMITAISQDFETNKIFVSLLLEYGSIQKLLELKEIEEIEVSLERYRAKRSRNANAYFHLLVGKLADKLRISKIRCKNIMIGSYGQMEFINGRPATVETQIPVSDMLEQESLHCMPCDSRIEEDGTCIYVYQVYRKSHTYNTEEMSILIDGVVQEAKEQGIETATPDEIERLKSLWKGGKNGQKTKECHTE